MVNNQIQRFFGFDITLRHAQLDADITIILSLFSVSIKASKWFLNSSGVVSDALKNHKDSKTFFALNCSNSS